MTSQKIVRDEALEMEIAAALAHRCRTSGS
jgi:hypothetical protein